MSTELTVDGMAVTVPDGATVLDACRTAGVDTPTLCFAEPLTPVNVCRACVVEVAGSRTLVPSCSRVAEDGMAVSTDSERVRRSRRLVFELLASGVDLDRAQPEVAGWMADLGCDTDRFAAAVPADVARPEPKIEDDMYVRDYDRCILCYRCVQACGDEAQFTFAIAVAGRGDGAHISTEHDVTLPESACVYCGNCIAVCPTGALTPTTEFDLRAAADWRPDDQTVTRTVCPYCGVGCNLDLHVQDDTVVKVTSPHDHDITSGNLCVKGRFGWQYLGSTIPKKTGGAVGP